MSDNNQQQQLTPYKGVFFRQMKFLGLSTEDIEAEWLFVVSGDIKGMSKLTVKWLEGIKR
jgi:hypothetical protein